MKPKEPLSMNVGYLESIGIRATKGSACWVDKDAAMEKAVKKFQNEIYKPLARKSKNSGGHVGRRWLPIETYIKPTRDNNCPRALFYSEATGIVIGSCYSIYSTSTAPEKKTYCFRCHDGFKIEPTHWMPLPPIPQETIFILKAYDPKKHGDLIPIEDFLELGFFDDDGEGYYATNNEISNISVNLKEVKAPESKFTHVCWYNK